MGKAFNVAYLRFFGNKRLAHLRFLCSKHSMQDFLDLTAHADLGIYVESVSLCIKGTEYGNGNDCQEEDVLAETEELDVKKVVLTTQDSSSCATDSV